ncbi:glutamate leucine phenylalanine valine dehydrogenase family protein, partial [Cystoisospora suis]
MEISWRTMHRTALLPMMRFTSLTCPSRLSNAATQQQRPRGTVLSRLCARIPPSRCTRRSSQGLRTNSGVSSCSEVLLSGVAETSSVRNNLMPIGLFACISSAGSGAVRTPGVTTSAGARALVRSADIAFPFSLSGISQQIQHSSTSRYSSFSLRRPHSTSSSCRLSLDTITRCCHSSPRALYSNRPDSSSCFSSLECPWIPVSCPIEVGVSSSISPLALSSPHSASFPDTRSFSYSVRNRRTQSSCLLALVKASSLRSHRRPSLLGPALSSFFPFRVSYRTAFSTTRQAKMDHAAATLNPSGARLPQASGSANSNRGMAGGSCNTIREESMERDHQHHHHHSSASKRVPCYTSYDGVNELMQHSSSNKSDSTQYPVVLDGTGDDMITSSTAGSPSLLNDHLSGDASSFLSHKNDPLHVKGVLGSRPVGKLGDSTLFGIGDSVSSLEYKSMSQKYAEQYEEVKQILLQRGDLSKRVVTANADAYYNHLGLNEYYFQTASPQTVANNLACVIAAKILNEMSHTDFFPQIQQERDGEVFLLAKASLRNRKASQNYKVEREIEAKFLNFEGKGLPYRMQCYRSTGSFFDDPADENERLRTYFLQQPEYAVPVEDVDPCETNLSKVLDVYFYNNKQNTATAEIYRRLNEEV